MAKLGLYDSCINPTIRFRDRSVNNSGSPLERNYKMIVATEEDLKAYDEQGTFKKGLTMLTKERPNVGEWTILEDAPTNLYEKIQSYREECDLRIILKKYQNGDESALNKVAGQYMDITDMPKNLAEMYARIKNLENDFETLPLDVRKEYGHSPAKWLKALSNGEYVSKFGQQVSKVEPEVKTEVKDEMKGEVDNE